MVMLFSIEGALVAVPRPLGPVSLPAGTWLSASIALVASRFWRFWYPRGSNVQLKNLLPWVVDGRRRRRRLPGGLVLSDDEDGQVQGRAWKPYPGASRPR